LTSEDEIGSVVGIGAIVCLIFTGMFSSDVGILISEN
jgi:hypothetical protein